MPTKTRALSINSLNAPGHKKSIFKADRQVYYQLYHKFKNLPATKWERVLSKNYDCSILDETMSDPDFYLIVATNIVLYYENLSKTAKDRGSNTSNSTIFRKSTSTITNSVLSFSNLLHYFENDEVKKAWYKFQNDYRSHWKHSNKHGIHNIFAHPVNRLDAISKLSIQLRSNPHFIERMKMFDKQNQPDLETKENAGVMNILSYVSGEEILSTLMLYCVLRQQTYSYLRTNVPALLDSFMNLKQVVNLLGKRLNLFPEWLIKEARKMGKNESEILLEVRKTLGRLTTPYGTPATLDEFIAEQDCIFLDNKGPRVFDPATVMIPEQREASFSDPLVDNFVIPTLNMYKERPNLIDYDPKQFPSLELLIKQFLAIRAPRPIDDIKQMKVVELREIWTAIQTAIREDKVGTSMLNTFTILVMASSTMTSVRDSLANAMHVWLLPLMTSLRSNVAQIRESACYSLMAILESDVLLDFQQKSQNLFLPMLVKTTLQGLTSYPESCAWYLAVLKHTITHLYCKCLPNFLIDLYERNMNNNNKFVQHFPEICYLIYFHWPVRNWLSIQQSISFVKYLDAIIKHQKDSHGRAKLCLEKIVKVTGIQPQLSTQIAD